MTTKRPKLNIKSSKNAEITVEINLNTLPKGFKSSYEGYTELVKLALIDFVTKNTDVTATMYVSHLESVNFHKRTLSAFFSVAGNNKSKVLDLLLATFEKHDVEARDSDAIAASKEGGGLLKFHIEDGHLWDSGNYHVIKMIPPLWKKVF